MQQQRGMHFRLYYVCENSGAVKSTEVQWAQYKPYATLYQHSYTYL